MNEDDDRSLGRRLRQVAQLDNMVTGEKRNTSRVVAMFVVLAVLIMCSGVLAYTLGLFQ